MNKSPDAFRTISEVADDLDLPQHVLRFWETRFSQIKPLKRGGGRRYYRPDDVDLLRGIRHLLYDEGYTIRGVQRLLKENGNKYVVTIGRGETPESASTNSADQGVSGPITSQGSSTDRPVPAKEAVTVMEFEKSQEKGRKSKSILGRFRGKDVPVGSEGAGSTVSADERRNLQATLYELLECKRLLDQVR